MFRRSFVGKRARDITGDAWLNTTSLPEKASEVAQRGKPIRFSHELSGTITLIHFWGYSSPDSVQELPYIHSWWEMYGDKGLLIIGVHTPEYSTSEDMDSVENAVLQFHLDYPIVHDPGYTTWKRYKNTKWPRKIVVNEKGKVVFDYSGKGGLDDTEQAFRALLAKVGNSHAVVHPGLFRPTPAIPLDRASMEKNGIALSPFTDPAQYHIPYKFPLHSIALSGWWMTDEHEIVSKEHTSDQSFAAHFFGPTVVATMRAVDGDDTVLKILVDGKVVDEAFHVSSNTEYTLFQDDVADGHILTLIPISGGIAISSILFS